MKHRGDPPAEPLQVRSIAGNLVATGGDVTAWYRVPLQQIGFRSDGFRADLLMNTARAYAGLAGLSIHLRVTSRPYPVRLWAQHLDAMTKATTRIRLPGCDGNQWEDHLATCQRHLMSSTLADKEVQIGVRLQRRGISHQAAAWATKQTGPLRRLAPLGGAITAREAQQLADETHRIDDIMARPGLAAKPCTAAEVEWLIHRSVALGMPAPLALSPVDDPRWDADDLTAFTDDVLYQRAAHGRYTKLTVARGDDVTRHVAVLTLGRTGPINPPGDEPWLQRVDRLGFPVEMSIRADVVHGHQVNKEIVRQLKIVRDQQNHYHEHEVDEPLELAEQAASALRISQELTSGDPVVSNRVHGWVRFAVSGTTERECLQRVRAVQALFTGAQMEVHHPRNGQYAMLREFIPGEPVASVAHTRHLPVLYFAAAMPQASASVGDRRGDYIGYTAGTSRRAVTHDLHYATEVREKPNLIPIVGEPGGGKTVLMAALCYLAVRRGVMTTILDPSGPLRQLTRLPEIAAVSSHVDLLRGEAGSLSPFSVVPDPLRGDFRKHDPEGRVLIENGEYVFDREAWETRAAEARQDRKMLAADVTRMLLPPKVAEAAATDIVLGDALRVASLKRTGSLWDVVKHLDGHPDPHGKIIANLLRDVADTPQARLFFPTDQAVFSREDEATLLVMTMDGLALPGSEVPREQWSAAELLAVPALHLATYRTAARAYGRPASERKIVALDEVGQTGQWRSGRALFNRFGRDSRKRNLAVLASSQNPADVLGLNVANLMGAAYVGRIEDDQVASEACRLLRIPQHTGYEPVIGGLSPHTSTEERRRHREFLFRDVDGNVEKIRVDLAHLPGFLEAVDTTAAPELLLS